ncbi:MAG: HYR domain-containing protein, partial [Gammaproteobacteria bacterium]|nr:HYR domain-containing protein [Gammaproteobacteria bacterium]
IQNINIVDTTPPVINAGSDVTLEATSVNGTSFTPKYSASDVCNCGEITINISPLASSYSLGNHTISVTATDISANAATDQMVLSVVDTTAPVLNIPASITMEASGGLTPVFVGDATATDIFPVTVVNDSPQVFPLGTSNVVWTATDANGNITTAMQSVTIIDSTAPTFELNVIKPTINRPNHKMKHVATVSGVQDLVDSAPVVDITVSSNGEHPHKHKHDHEDWKIEEVDGEWLIWVRAEKLKHNKEDRVYHIDVSVSDFTGNTAQQSTDITVLRNHSHSGKHDEHKQKKSDKKHSESDQHQEKQKDLDGRKHDRHQTHNQKREHNRKKHD